MSFSKLSAVVFGVIFIAILYFIIYYALKIMYKDVKIGGKRRAPVRKSNYGIEVIEVASNSNVRKGSVIPIKNNITVGRKEGNSVVLSDKTVSGNHARLFIKNDVLYIEDLESTNGTFINKKKISGRIKLFAKDEINIGSTTFIVLG